MVLTSTNLVAAWAIPTGMVRLKRARMRKTASKFDSLPVLDLLFMETPPDMCFCSHELPLLPL